MGPVGRDEADGLLGRAPRPGGRAASGRRRFGHRSQAPPDRWRPGARPRSPGPRGLPHRGPGAPCAMTWVGRRHACGCATRPRRPPRRPGCRSGDARRRCSGGQGISTVGPDRAPAQGGSKSGTGPALARHWPVQARQRHEARDQPPLPPGSSRWRLDGSICRTGSPNQRPSRIGQVWIAASRTGHGAAAVAPGDRPPLHPRVTPDQPRAAPPQGRVAGPPVGRAVGRQGWACSLGNLGLTRVRPVGWSGVGPAPPSRLPGSRGPSRARMRPAGRDGGRESETGHRTRRHGWPP